MKIQFLAMGAGGQRTQMLKPGEERRVKCPCIELIPQYLPLSFGEGTAVRFEVDNKSSRIPTFKQSDILESILFPDSSDLLSTIDY
jgi:hypothetical protein